MAKYPNAIEYLWPFALAVLTGVGARMLRLVVALPVIGDVDYAIIALGVGTAALVAASVQRMWVAVATPFVWVGAHFLVSLLVELVGLEIPDETWLSRPIADLVGSLCAVAGPSLILIGAILGVRHMYSTQRFTAGRCAVCGYDLRGSPGPRCPECGTTFTPTGEEQEEMISRGDAEDAEKRDR